MSYTFSPEEMANMQNVSDYEKELEIDPANVTALYNKGLALAKLGKFTEAIENYDKALEIQETRPLFTSKGKALYYLTRFQEALQCFNYALDYDSSHVETLGFAGSSLYEMGKYAEAMEYFEKALVVDSEDTRAYYGKKDCLKQLSSD